MHNMEWEKIDSRSLTTGGTQSESGAADEPGSCHFLSTVFSPVSSLHKASDSQARRGQMEMSSEQKEEKETKCYAPWWWHEGRQSRRVISDGIEDRNQVLFSTWKATSCNKKSFELLHLNTHTLTLRHSPIAACTDPSTFIILIILGLCNRCVFIQTQQQLVLLRNKIMWATHYFFLIARFREIGFSGTRAITSLCELRLDCLGNCFIFFAQNLIW